MSDRDGKLTRIVWGKMMHAQFWYNLGSQIQDLLKPIKDPLWASLCSALWFPHFLCLIYCATAIEIAFFFFHCQVHCNPLISAGNTLLMPRPSSPALPVEYLSGFRFLVQMSPLPRALSTPQIFSPCFNFLLVLLSKLILLLSYCLFFVSLR